jgi:hypothetical protein
VDAVSTSIRTGRAKGGINTSKKKTKEKKKPGEKK